jgi:magnesium chelatase subunit I
VALFNILQEGDIQIRGFKLRMPLDILFIFTANPEDYTNRGAIVTPLKDRIQSQILTHYPRSIENSLAITEQEASVHEDQKLKIKVSDLVKRLIEQVSFEARSSEFVDQKSGVSARLTIAAYENAFSAAERRAILNKEKETQVWISDLVGIIPSITGKVELVYEGEQEGPYQVAFNLMEKALRSQFAHYFPNPDSLKKKRTRETVQEENPFRSIITWFDKGNSLNMLFSTKDADKIQLLYKVDGLYSLVKKYFPHANEKENALLMEFVLHGLSAHSLISKKVLENKIEFKDLMGSMINLGHASSYRDEDDLDEDNFR